MDTPNVFVGLMEGTIVNAAGILLGSAIGAALHSRLPKGVVSTMLQAIGLMVLLLGISMALLGTDYVLMIASLVIGVAIGEVAGIERRLDAFAIWFRKRAHVGDGRLAAGFVTASLIFCTGSMAILGAVEDGIGQEPKILYAKAALDALISLGLASAMGIGVALSAVPVFLYQGGITLLAANSQGVLAGGTLSLLSGVGGILLMGVGINLLEIKKINVANMLPSLLVALALKIIFP